ncbi:hypothetical protein [Cognatiluteimonas telluris]|jgi:hypothetical protein|uniref:hypothetical protein n=1 Tax=Cognatiluteimonas telluris TaxID=1104775 RepID=UPI001A9CB82E|nr:hypothetical protein [Lysobacter telluris]
MPPIRPLSIHVLALSVLMACAPLAFAQDAAPAAATQPAIQQQMTPEEFKAAGLDKLSADELARLNAWLGRTIDTQTAKAAAQAKERVEHENRGFFNFGSDEPIVSALSGEFRGFARNREYTLDNGQVWKQVDDEELPGVRLTHPEVHVYPAVIGNVWYMKVGRYNTRARVQRIK